jgi:hypothetical protein
MTMDRLDTPLRNEPRVRPADEMNRPTACCCRNFR